MDGEPRGRLIIHQSNSFVALVRDRLLANKQQVAVFHTGFIHQVSDRAEQQILSSGFCEPVDARMYASMFSSARSGVLRAKFPTNGQRCHVTPRIVFS